MNITKNTGLQKRLPNEEVEWKPIQFAFLFRLEQFSEFLNGLITT